MNWTAYRQNPPLQAVALIVLALCLAAQPAMAGPVTVDPALLAALETQQRVGARIYFTVPAAPDPSVRQSFVLEDVDPVVLDLAQIVLPGELSVVQYEWVRALRGVVDANVLSHLSHHPQVLSIELDESVTVAVAEPDLLHTFPCSPSSTRACVQSGRFSIEVATSAGFQPVAATSSDSAVFHFGVASNWEVVAKVLNGCSINGRYWVFGAGATSLGYSLHFVDLHTGRSIAYNGGALCPITDTAFFLC